MADSVSFDLPIAPSVNNLFGNTPSGRVQKRHYRKWRKKAGLEIIRQGRQFLTDQRLAIEIIIDRRGHGRRDLDNFCKAILDILVEMQVIGDDSLVEELHMRWGDVPGCRVTVSSA